MTRAAALVPSTIVHARHQPVAHRLERPGLSLLLDLDKLDEANRASGLFSVGRFNLLSFDERDHGPNYAAKRMVEPLSSYIRRLAREFIPDAAVARVELLTFPRVLGQVFNPISVYRCLDAEGRMLMAVYEVRNTFGDMHSYIGVDDGLHEASKVFHVSPFFPVAGEYRLRIRQQEQKLSLAIRYQMEGAAALTATLRGEIRPISALGIISTMLKMRLWPMRPLVSIHWEAFKLWRKKVPFFHRPQPPGIGWTLAINKGNSKGIHK